MVISPESFFTGAAVADSKNIEEAVLALVQLGFKYDMAKKSIMKIVHELPDEEHNSENLIRLALQNLNS
jgi:Holliday junction resolvasome RuvABC DNA-binding subunit